MGTLLILTTALLVSGGSWFLGTSKVAFGSYLDWVARESGILFLAWFVILAVSILLALLVQKKENRKIIWFDSFLLLGMLAFRLVRTMLFIVLAVQWGSLVVGFLGILVAWISVGTGELMFSIGTLILSPKRDKEPFIVKVLYRAWEALILI